MGVLCSNLQLPSFPSGNGCESVPVLNQQVLVILDALCGITCGADEIKCTTDTNPLNWPALWTDDGCAQVECGSIAVVLNGGGTIDSLNMWNGTSWEPVLGGDNEYRTGTPGFAAVESAPTIGELNLLFAGTPALSALVLVESTGIFWFTSDGGLTWDAASNNSIHATQNTSNNNVSIVGATGGAYFQIYNGVIYSGGSAGSTPLVIKAGDLVIFNCTVSYDIVNYGAITNPVDAVILRLRLTGAVTSELVTPTVKNGHYETFSRTYVATYAGDINLIIDGTFNGSGTGWTWTARKRYLNVAVISS